MQAIWNCVRALAPGPPTGCWRGAACAGNEPAAKVVSAAAPVCRNKRRCSSFLLSYWRASQASLSAATSARCFPLSVASWKAISRSFRSGRLRRRNQVSRHRVEVFVYRSGEKTCRTLKYGVADPGSFYFDPRLKRIKEGALLRAATRSSRPSPSRSPLAIP